MNKTWTFKRRFRKMQQEIADQKRGIQLKTEINLDFEEIFREVRRCSMATGRSPLMRNESLHASAAVEHALPSESH